MATLLLTRPGPLSDRFRALVGGDAPVVVSPLVRIEPVPATLPPGVAAAVVTSGHGAAALSRLGLERRVPVYAVGARTAEIAREAGYAATSADGDADALVRLILQLRPPGPLVHVRGARSRGDVARRLTEAGLPCTEAVAYRQLAEPLSPAARRLLRGDGAVVVPLFSPDAGSMFAAQGPFAAPLRLVCISAAVAAAVAGLPAASRDVAERPDIAAMAALTRARVGA